VVHEPSEIDAVSGGFEYRLDRLYLFMGLVGVLVSVAALIGGIAVKVWDRPAPNPIAAAVMFFVVIASFFGISTWIVLAYFRERLIISHGSVKVRGVLRLKAIEVAAVQQARWRSRPAGGGSLVLSNQESWLVVPLSQWRTDDRREMVEYFHSALPDENQEHWPEFEKRMCPWRHPGGYGPRGGWRNQVPFTVTILLIGVVSLVFIPFVPANLAYGIAFTGLVNLTGGWYFARGILRHSRAERDAESS